MTPRTATKPIDILLVEDSPADILITREAFQDARLLNTIHVVEDGVQALEFLHRQGSYASAPRPDLILLDLNLPRKNGHEVLAEIKESTEFKSIPVIILTTSNADEDILKAYDLRANCYVVKPVGFDNFLKAVQSIQNFWFSVVVLPPEA